MYQAFLQFEINSLDTSSLATRDLGGAFLKGANDNGDLMAVCLLIWTEQVRNPYWSQV